MEFYCLKCKKKVEATPKSSEKMKGRTTKLHRGTCPKCKGNIARIAKA